MKTCIAYECLKDIPDDENYCTFHKRQLAFSQGRIV